MQNSRKLIKMEATDLNTQAWDACARKSALARFAHGVWLWISPTDVKGKECKTQCNNNKDCSLKKKSETTQKHTSERPFMWSCVGVEKFRVDTHTILKTYKEAQWSTSSVRGMLWRINRIHMKTFSIMTYSEVVAQTSPSLHHNRRCPRTSYSTVVVAP